MNLPWLPPLRLSRSEVQRELGLRGPVAAVSAGSQRLPRALQPDGGVDNAGARIGRGNTMEHVSRNIMESQWG